MTVVRSRDQFVHCDGDGCHKALWADQAENADQARRQARRNGWVRRDGLDLCPSCKEKP